MPGKAGQIITFYSYKGGTGRTMVLANIAWILASNGKKVLAVDWDLEAPGLHRYFRPFLLDQDLTASLGIIDLVWKFASAAVAPIENPDEVENDWHEDYADVLRYVITLRWNFKLPGKIDFLPPGLQGPAYAARVNSFNWQNFYDRLGGGAFLEAVKDRMRQEYDYILIDSRTGVSDTSGICTVQMPDDLVVCFTASHQSLEGVLAVATSVRKQWSESRVRKSRGRIFPVLMRAEAGEMRKLILARQEARSRFSPFLDFLPTSVQDEYWGYVETPYIPWYAFEEVLAPFVDEPKVINSVLGAAERLTQYLTDRNVLRAISPEREARELILDQYLRTDQDRSLEKLSLTVSPDLSATAREEPGLELSSQSSVSWKSFLVCMTGAVFFFLFRAVSEPIFPMASSVLLYIAIGFLTAAILAFTGEYRARATTEREFSNRVADQVFQGLLAHLLPPAVLDEVNSIIHIPYIRSNCMYVLTFRRPSHGMADDCVVIRRELSFSVENLTTHSVIFPIRYSAPTGRNPNNIKPGSFLALSVEGVDVPNLRSYVTTGLEFSTLEYPLSLGPKEIKVVYLAGEEISRIDSGSNYYIQGSLVIGISIDIQNQYPERIKDIQVFMHHPARVEMLSGLGRCSLNRAFLPGQGFEIRWDTQEP